MVRTLFTMFAGVAVLAATSLFPTSASAAANYKFWPHTVIYVQDDTAAVRAADGSPLWPVKAAAEKWGAGNPIEFRYVTTGCPLGTQCVTVSQGELSGRTVGEATVWSVGSTITSADVVLGRSYGRSASSANRRNTVCHELGHALGLAHSSTKGSCMYATVTSARFPGKADVTDLNIMY